MPSIWWVNAKGEQSGPIELTQAVGLVKTGMIAPATLVWSEGMAGWTAASETEALGGYFRSGGPQQPIASTPTAHSAPSSVAPGYGAVSAVSDDALVSSVTAWGLFWRAIVYTIGNLLVIPAPWTGTMYWRYLATTTNSRGGLEFEFAGEPLDIWWVFTASGLLEWIGLWKYGQGWTTLVQVGLGYLLVSWFVGKVRPEGRTQAFNGGFWGYFGYSILLGLSMVTIIGWAWVLRSFLNWMCRHAVGAVRFEFQGTGLELLWRGFVAVFVSCLIVTIPWMMAWYYCWIVSQIHVDEDGAAL